MSWSLRLLFQAAVMDLVDSDKERGLETPVWATYIHMLKQSGSQVVGPTHTCVSVCVCVY